MQICGLAGDAGFLHIRIFCEGDRKYMQKVVFLVVSAAKTDVGIGVWRARKIQNSYAALIGWNQIAAVDSTYSAFCLFCILR